ncbi:MAG: hypothetical protein HY749_07200 [Gammaproteobacteria bacterium]|nr:hypothetical protein [Gammaproteobacteria bacterium]MBI5615756.1 hypothetical protein [Gammaproteobacteria bacterium]
MIRHPALSAARSPGTRTFALCAALLVSTLLPAVATADGEPDGPSNTLPVSLDPAVPAGLRVTELSASATGPDAIRVDARLHPVQSSPLAHDAVMHVAILDAEGHERVHADHPVPRAHATRHRAPDRMISVTLGGALAPGERLAVSLREP